MGKRKTTEQLKAEVALSEARDKYNAAKAAHRKFMEKLKK